MTCVKTCAQKQISLVESIPVITAEAEAGGLLQVKASLGYSVRPCLPQERVQLDGSGYKGALLPSLRICMQLLAPGRQWTDRVGSHGLASDFHMNGEAMPCNWTCACACTHTYTQK